MSRFASVTLKFFVNAARQTCITISWLGVRSDLATGTGNALGILPDSVLAPCDTERYKEEVRDFTLMGARQPLLDHCTTPSTRKTSSKAGTRDICRHIDAGRLGPFGLRAERRTATGSHRFPAFGASAKRAPCEQQPGQIALRHGLRFGHRRDRRTRRRCKNYAHTCRSVHR